MIGKVARSFGTCSLSTLLCRVLAVRGLPLWMELTGPRSQLPTSQQEPRPVHKQTETLTKAVRKGQGW